MWAGGRAKANNWYVFYSYVYSLKTYFSVYSSSGYPYCTNWHNPVPMNLPVTYFYNYPTKNLNVNLLNVGTNAAMNSLQLRLSLTVNSSNTISMSPSASYTGSYVSFRFKIVNYEFGCGAFTRFAVSYARPGNFYSDTRDHSANNLMVKCVNDN